MASRPAWTVRALAPPDLPALRRLNALFGDAFEDPGAYRGRPPSDNYLARALARDGTIAIVAEAGGEVIGGLVAYELEKLEQERREVYVYDLAVQAAWRRRGVATAAIEHLRALAAERGASAIFVQADRDDEPAIALYTSLGRRQDVHHFDIPVGRAGRGGLDPLTRSRVDADGET